MQRTKIGISTRVRTPLSHRIIHHNSVSLVNNMKNAPHVLPPSLETMKPHPEQDIVLKHQNIKKKSSDDHYLNNFLRILSNKPFHEAIETFFKKYFPGSTTIYWDAIDEVRSLFSETRNFIVNYSSGILGFAFQTRKIFRLFDPEHHPLYHETDQRIIPPKSCLLLFPVYNLSKKFIGLVQIIRLKEDENDFFTSKDEVFIEWFQKKISFLSQLIQPPNRTELDILKLENCSDFFKNIGEKVAKVFNCADFELWEYNQNTQYLRILNPVPRIIKATQLGIVGNCIFKGESLNFDLENTHPWYNSIVDGKYQSAILVHTIQNQDSSYSFVLRSPNLRPIFTYNDKLLLEHLSKQILQAYLNSSFFDKIFNENSENSTHLKLYSTMMNGTEEIALSIKNNNFLDLISQKAKILANADRFSLFLLNQQKDHLISKINDGISNPLNLPVSTGIVGRTFCERKVFNIQDPYKCDFFNRSIDDQTGYETKSIISIPLYNQSQQLLGVVQFINKLTGSGFTEFDVELLTHFVNLLGIYVDFFNLSTSFNLEKSHLSLFGQFLESITSDSDVNDVLSKILKNAKRIAQAESSQIFLKKKKEYESALIEGTVYSTSVEQFQEYLGKKGLFFNDCQSKKNLIQLLKENLFLFFHF